MVNLIISFIIAVVAAIAPWSAFSADLDFTKADQLIKKYNTVYERPKSCPMESTKFSDLVTKTEELKDVLKGNCLQKDSSKLNDVLDSIKSMQDELKTQTALTSTNTGSTIANVLNELSDDTSTASTSSDSTTATSTNTINGLKYSAIFSNLTTMFKKNQCNMEDGRVLEKTADLIYDATQLGVVAGNQLGLIVAGSGFVVSSALRLIDLIIKQRFDFDKAADRQSFVKLNCAFYEVRRQLEAQGALDIENNTSRDDFRDVKAFNEELTATLKKIDEEKVNTVKSNTEIEANTFKSNVGDVTELRKTLAKMQKYLQAGVKGTVETPTETQKLLMISQLAQDYDLLVNQVNAYRELKLSSIPMLDDLFLNEMKKFDSLDIANFTTALNMSAKDFNDNSRAIILFHIIRINGDIAKKEQGLSEKNAKAKAEFATSLDKKKELYTAKLIELKKVETRLGNLVSPKEYSGLDDGSENMVTILENHKKISSQLYGEWGEKFLKYATYKSADGVKEFNERLELFNSKYGDNMKSNTQSGYICQDAQKLRLLFKQADNFVQEGFDFVATNKDIIYSDVKNYYNGTINEESDKIGVMGPVEKVQRHYKSAVLALKVIRGTSVTQDQTERYLSKQWGSSFYIGKSMLDVSASRAKAKNIQDVYERIGCQKSMNADLD
jgi:hypothetical protein